MTNITRNYHRIREMAQTGFAQKEYNSCESLTTTKSSKPQKPVLNLRENFYDLKSLYLSQTILFTVKICSGFHSLSKGCGRFWMSSGRFKYRVSLNIFRNKNLISNYKFKSTVIPH